MMTKILVKEQGRTATKAGIAGIVMVLALAGFFTVSPIYAQAYNSGSGGIQSLENIQNSFRAIAQKVIPTVVEVDVVDVVKAPVQQEFKQYGLGSGVMVRRDGNKVYVLTNNHVVGAAAEISVKFSDGRQFAAKLVGTDERKDLALVVFETKEQVPIAQLGDSDNLQVGDWVLAIGNPLGFSSTITSGIVSALGRNSVPGMGTADFADYIQTDAAINQGNSGGALVNLRGEVVGINTWIASNSGGNIGLGFAIPVNSAKKDIDSLISKGKIEYGWLGASIGSLPADLSTDMKLTGIGGAFIYNIFKGSPADQAGILPGDYVTALNGTPVKDPNHLLKMIGNLSPGDRVSFDIVRNGAKLNVTAKIAVRAGEEEIAKQAAKVWPGIYVTAISDDSRKSLSLPGTVTGVVIVSVEKGSASDVAGLRQGDVIEKIGDKNIATMSDFYSFMAAKKGSELNFRIFRQGVELMIGLAG